MHKALDFLSVISFIIFMIIVISYQELQAYIIEQLGNKDSILRFALATGVIPFIIQFYKSTKKTKIEKQEIRIDGIEGTFNRKFEDFSRGINDVKIDLKSVVSSHNNLAKKIENDVVKNVKCLRQKIEEYEDDKNNIKLYSREFDEEWSSTLNNFNVSDNLKKSARLFYFSFKEFCLFVHESNIDNHEYDQFAELIVEKFKNQYDSFVVDITSILSSEFIEELINNNSSNVFSYINDIDNTFSSKNIVNDRYKKFQRHSLIFIGKTLNTFMYTFREYINKSSEIL